MKRNQASMLRSALASVSILLMTTVALAQTPTVVEKPAGKTSPATVKVLPPTAANAAGKPSSASAAKPSSVKQSQAPAVSVQPATVKAGSAKVAMPATNVAAGKTNSGSLTKPVAVVAAPSKQVAVSAQSSKPVVISKPVAVPASTTASSTTKVKATAVSPNAKVVVPQAAVASAKSSKGVQVAPLSAKPHAAQVAAQASSKSGTTIAVQDHKVPTESKKPEAVKANANGRRDPFVSPVVNFSAVGSGCASGKRCLAIDQVALRGIVKSDVGMIAVVVNAMDKAYFLRENDPVFNGYVLKITGDSIVFKETFKDRLGKPLTRDVTKTITRPAV